MQNINAKVVGIQSTNTDHQNQQMSIDRIAIIKPAITSPPPFFGASCTGTLVFSSIS